MPYLQQEIYQKKQKSLSIFMIICLV